MALEGMEVSSLTCYNISNTNMLANLVLLGYNVLQYAVACSPKCSSQAGCLAVGGPSLQPPNVLNFLRLWRLQASLRPVWRLSGCRGPLERCLCLACGHATRVVAVHALAPCMPQVLRSGCPSHM